MMSNTAAMSVSLTERAAAHVAKFLDKRGKGMGLRLGVKTTGCSGLAYKLEYADEVAAARKTMLADLQHCADAQQDWSALAGQVRSLMFVERFARDVSQRLDQLGQ